mmetsp:Transcript_16275/g.52079  ORF Transcript_16275/g.52079 Transcript_16275/m.52079 type:complete len:267 (-) Transcript_16275:258-1058(-)
MLYLAYPALPPMRTSGERTTTWHGSCTQTRTAQCPLLWRRRASSGCALPTSFSSTAPGATHSTRPLSARPSSPRHASRRPLHPSRRRGPPPPPGRAAARSGQGPAAPAPRALGLPGPTEARESSAAPRPRPPPSWCWTRRTSEKSKPAGRRSGRQPRPCEGSTPGGGCGGRRSRRAAFARARRRGSPREVLPGLAPRLLGVHGLQARAMEGRLMSGSLFEVLAQAGEPDGTARAPRRHQLLLCWRRRLRTSRRAWCAWTPSRRCWW